MHLSARAELSAQAPIISVRRQATKMLTIHIDNCRVYCTGCGTVQEIAGSLNVVETTNVHCPSCGAEFYLVTVIQLMEISTLKSNSATLAALADQESDIEAELDEIQNEIPAEPTGSGTVGA